jgi:hypothetical protein
MYGAEVWQIPTREINKILSTEMDVWCAGLDETAVSSKPAHQTVIYTETYTKCRIDTINYPDDGHVAARNMYRKEINIHEKELCVRLVIYKDYDELGLDLSQTVNQEM